MTGWFIAGFLVAAVGYVSARWLILPWRRDRWRPKMPGGEDKFDIEFPSDEELLKYWPNDDPAVTRQQIRERIEYGFAEGKAEAVTWSQKAEIAQPNPVKIKCFTNIIVDPPEADAYGKVKYKLRPVEVWVVLIIFRQRKGAWVVEPASLSVIESRAAHEWAHYCLWIAKDERYALIGHIREDGSIVSNV